MDLISLLITTLLTAVIFRIVQHIRKNKSLPPGPTGLPIVGYLPFINGKRVYSDLFKLGSKYGSVFSITLGSQTVIVCNEAKSIRTAFGKPELSGRPLQFPNSYFHKGNFGIIYSGGETWLDQRRYTLRHLRDCGMGRSAFEDQVILEVAAAVKLLQKDADTNKPANFAHGVNAAVFNSLWCIVSGNRFDYSDSKFLKLAEDMTDLFEEFLQRSCLITFFPWLGYILPNSGFLTDQFVKLVETVNIYAKNTVEEHKSAYDENNIKDFTDMYLKEIKTQEKSTAGKTTFAEYQLQALIGDFFLAGFETVSSTMQWGVALLAAHPDIQTKVQQEIDQVIGRDRVPGVSDRSALHYTNATIAEIQRYASIIPLGVFHTAEVDCELLGYVIPKDTIILSNIYGSHHDPKVWKNPENFDPENFLKDDGSFNTDAEGFVPFSIGKRQCAGEGIARMELFHFVVTFLQHFTFELPPGVSNDIQPPKHREASRGPPDCKILIHSRK